LAGGSLVIDDRARAGKPVHSMISGQASWQVDDDTSVNRAIGDRLRDHYRPMIGERIPPRLLELLRQADEKSPPRDGRTHSAFKKRKRR
jgi:hypothetical protein